jgi:hypothetical protein
MRKLLCKWFELHKWKDISATWVGRRNLNRRLPDGTIMLEDGPEETFFPDPNGPNFPRRECTICGERQHNSLGRWW